MNLLVSVIIPVYNVYPFLHECVDSVLNQSYNNLEIIIIDDGSSDGSEKICDDYARKDSRIQVVHQSNKGLSSARNTGLDLLKGNIVAFLDSDDAYHPEYIKTMLEYMLQQNIDLVLCKHTLHITDKEMKQDVNSPMYPTIEEGIYNREESLRALVDNRMNHVVWNKLYRRDLWDGIRFPEGHVYEDLDTTYKVFDCCSLIGVINKPLYLKRTHAGTITGTYSKKNILDWMLARSHFESFVFSNVPDTFTKEQRRQLESSRICRMIDNYIYYSDENDIRDKDFEEDLRIMIMNLNTEYAIKQCNFRYKFLYFMICRFPRILNIVNKIYHHIR